MGRRPTVTALRDDWAKQPLTPQQLKILACLSEGVLPRDVPAKMGLSRSAFHSQLQRLCTRLGVENWVQALYIYRPAVDLFAKMNQAEILLRDVLLDPKTNNTLAQPKLLHILDELGRARQILKAL